HTQYKRLMALYIEGYIEHEPEYQGIMFFNLPPKAIIRANNVWTHIYSDLLDVQDFGWDYYYIEYPSQWGLSNLFPPYHATWIEFRDIEVHDGIGFRNVSYGIELYMLPDEYDNPNPDDSESNNILCEFRIYGQLDNDRPELLYSGDFVLTRDGTILDVDDPDWYIYLGGDIVYTNLRGILYPALMSLQFLNCKNVELVDYEPSPRIKQLSEKHRVPLDTYKVLKVNTTRKVYPDREGDDSPSDPKRLHIVRGHFAHYTDEAPLFGKYTGTFWIPAHVRGDESVGMVVKDYEIGE
ncbi:MAG: hypothetical protein K8L99_12420, partial [Anaerolineae bacterium]|nr:hypothetical protein [Anaerolineae bacterium]